MHIFLKLWSKSGLFAPKRFSFSKREMAKNGLYFSSFKKLYNIYIFNVHSGEIPYLRMQESSFGVQYLLVKSRKWI